MAKMTKSQLGKQGSEIMRMAKQIRSKSPGKKWTNCVKEAGRKFKKG